MGVTDLTPTLPWGGSPNGQPQLPPGYGGGTSWLNYLASMFGPGSAQAAGNDPNANPHGDGPPGPVDPRLGYSLTANGPAPAQANAMIANGPPRQTLAGSQPNQGGGFGAGPSWFPSGGNTPMPWNGPTATPPPRPVNPNAPSPAAQTVSSPAAPGVLSGGATSANRGAPMGAGPGASNRFVQLDQGQNMDPTNRRGGPQMTALNLAGLFGGGGQPAGQGAPQGAPSQTPRPTVPGPMATAAANAPWSMGPTQQGRSFPTGPNLPPGGRTMNPTQLASAVKKPNWWNFGNA